MFPFDDVIMTRNKNTLQNTLRPFARQYIQGDFCFQKGNIMPHHTRIITPYNKVHGANTGPTWGRQDPGGPGVGPMNCVIWDRISPAGWYYQHGAACEIF